MQLTDTACVLDYKELSNQTPSALMGFNFIVKKCCKPPHFEATKVSVHSVGLALFFFFFKWAGHFSEYIGLCAEL